MKKIDILIGDNPYGTTVHFSKSLSRSLELLGLQTRLFWVGEGHFFHAFYEIMQSPPDLTCSFSDISLEKKPLGDMWRIPHLSLLVDPPIYFLHQLTGLYSWISCVDAGDCDFVRSIIPHVFFLPHAVEKDLYTPVKKERPYEAVFFGTCIDYEEVATQWTKQDKDLLLTASERVLSDKGVSILQALIELGVKEEDLARCHAEVDQYTRGKDRVELMRSIKNTQVHIWGAGPWKKYCPEHHVHAPISVERVVEVMKKSKIVLNSSPRFKAGAHERIFYASMCGSAVLTGQNGYLSTQLPDVFTYRFGEWEAPSFEQWQSKAEASQQRVLDGHTWDARAATMIKEMTQSMRIK